MLNHVDLSGRPFHFIGIGGIGMSALAYVLTKRNLPVSGSDIASNSIMQRLEKHGATIFLGQEAANLDRYQATDSLAGAIAQSPIQLGSAAQQLPQVVCSTAIHPDNAELRAAQNLGCPMLHRSDVLAALMQEYEGIAVAGTHGKTTTSSLIGFLLLKAGLDPTIVVGGEVSAWQGNAHVGHSRLLVAEADESDGSLVKLCSKIGIITNIELDHPDHYQDLNQLIQTFTTFADQCQTLVGCWDCDIIRQHLHPSISYSLDPSLGADYTVDQVEYQADGTIARVWEAGKPLGKIHLSLLGRHNLSNALAAIATARHLGVSFERIASLLPEFRGARRRFEHRGEVNNIVFIDDYAHHPSEIQATLSAARLRVQSPKSPQKRLVAVFQPHRYSRTETFLDDFAQSFQDADVVITTEIYSAGEPNPGTVSGEMLAQAIRRHHSTALYQPSLSDVSTFLRSTLEPGDLVLFLGAGNLNRVIPELLAHYQQLEAESVAVEATSAS